MTITTLSESTPVARKDHRCGACLGVIGRGDRYVRQTNGDSGDLWVWKAHQLCHAISWRLTELYCLDGESPNWASVQDELRSFFAALSGWREAA